MNFHMYWKCLFVCFQARDISLPKPNSMLVVCTMSLDGYSDLYNGHKSTDDWLYELSFSNLLMIFGLTTSSGCENQPSNMKIFWKYKAMQNYNIKIWYIKI